MKKLIKNQGTGMVVKFISFCFLIIAVGLIFFEVHLLTHALGAEDDEGAGAPASEAEEFKQDEGSKCEKALKGFLEDKRREFGEFINTHFNSALPTSELIPTAVELFRQYREQARKKADEFFPADKTLSETAFAEKPKCEQVLKEDFALMKSLLRQHILANAYAKKSTRLIDKYKQINSKLEKLNFTIAQTYGYFAALSQKLPCYATDCIKQ